MDLTECRIRK